MYHQLADKGYIAVMDRIRVGLSRVVGRHKTGKMVITAEPSHTYYALLVEGIAQQRIAADGAEIVVC